MGAAQQSAFSQTRFTAKDAKSAKVRGSERFFRIFMSNLFCFASFATFAVSASTNNNRVYEGPEFLAPEIGACAINPIFLSVLCDLCGEPVLTEC
jgi:hypothetical protein